MTNCVLIGTYDKKRDNFYLKKGYCNRHYLRQYRGFSLDNPSRNDARLAVIQGDIAKIPLGVNAKDGYAIVDKEFAWLEKHQWTKLPIGYAHNSEVGYLHHNILGKPANGLLLDHINRDKLDNRVRNLRFADFSQSVGNTKPRAQSFSDYKGVQFNKQKNKWQALITKKRKKTHLGFFIVETDAARAYDEAAKEYWGEYAYLNFPDDIINV